jgi:hypothetical protein
MNENTNNKNVKIDATQYCITEHNVACYTAQNANDVSCETSLLGRGECFIESAYGLVSNALEYKHMHGAVHHVKTGHNVKVGTL